MLILALRCLLNSLGSVRQVRGCCNMFRAWEELFPIQKRCCFIRTRGWIQAHRINDKVEERKDGNFQRLVTAKHRYTTSCANRDIFATSTLAPPQITNLQHSSLGPKSEFVKCLVNTLYQRTRGRGRCAKRSSPAVSYDIWAGLR